jgi:palmitoyltransferase
MLRGGNGYLRAKRRTRQAWDAEYGRIGREGNMWWLGSIRANKQVFGDVAVAAYVLSFSLFSLSYIYNVRAVPIGTAMDKGLEYQRNPRFNA